MVCFSDILLNPIDKKVISFCCKNDRCKMLRIIES